MTFWTNESVLAFAGQHDPEEAIVARAQEVALAAMSEGWSGPPFDPFDLARRMGIGVVPQSMAQIRSRYRESADSILANSTTKLFMGPVGDEATLNYLGRVLGSELEDDADARRPKAPAAELQQLDIDRALLIEGRLPPAVIRLVPWWEDGELRGRAE